MTTKSQQKRLPPTSAPESNAGDDFHLLYAACKVLELLDSKSSLKALSVEGLAPQDGVAIDLAGEFALGIDLTEYFEGTTFDTASRVVHSQLKYSTRHPNQPWTSARLTTGKTGGPSGSIIHKLAQVFSRYCLHRPRNRVIERLVVRLVSNRPLDENLSAGLQEAKRILAKMPDLTRLQDLQRSLSADAWRHIKPLAQRSGLTSGEFLDFLHVLDLSGCGAGSRMDQQVRLVQALGECGFQDVRRQNDALVQFIRKQMMPESRGVAPLTADDVVPYFGASSVRSLFPAESRFAALASPVHRAQMSEIAKGVRTTSKVPLCLHGPAGVGKTTIAQSLASYLPEDSVVVVFDCYGGGSYLDPGEIRHTHRRAIQQISNELAVKTGAPLLLTTDMPGEDLLRELKRRLTIASQFVKAKNIDALIVVVVDAADNSIVAAEHFKEKSFITELVACEVPDGCRLVVTSRSHRRQSLSLPTDAKEIALAGFTKPESKLNLCRLFPSCTNSQAEEFHRLSGGIPRVQGYALSAEENGIENILNSLRPTGKRVEGIIDDQIREACRRLGITEPGTNIFKSLLSLYRPIPIEYISELAAISADAIRDFCIDLYPGLRLNEDSVSFCDEDFEEHIRGRFTPDPDMIFRAAELLLIRAQTAPYAAFHVADALARAGRHAEIRNLVMQEKLPRIISDLVERRVVFARRTRLALMSCLDSEMRTEYIGLLLVAAEAAKTDEAVRQLVVENADLASKYGDPATVQRLYLSDAKSSWYGPTHLLCAANYARNDTTVDQARQHLKAASGWLNWWSELPDQERQNLHISEDDIAAGAEAILRIKDEVAALLWLESWVPSSLAYESGRRMVLTVLRAEGERFFERESIYFLRSDAVLAIVEAAADVGLNLPYRLTLKAVRVWDRYLRTGGKTDASLVRSGLALCEAATMHKIPVKRLLETWKVQLPEHRISLFGDSISRIDIFLRVWTLASASDGYILTVDDLYPDRLRKIEPDISKINKVRMEEERSEFKALYELLLPPYIFRARCLLGGVDSQTIEDQLGKCLGVIGADYKLERERDADGIRKLLALTLTDVAIRFSSKPRDWFSKIEKTCCKPTDKYLRLCLAEKAVSHTETKSEALRLADEVSKYAVDNPTTARDQVASLVRCARIGDAVDTMAGRHYFDLAVEAASEVDEEAYVQLPLIDAFAQKAVQDNPNFCQPGLALDFACFVEECSCRMEGWDHFPWTECVNAIAMLDPATALAVLCRWDQKGILEFKEEILTALSVFHRREYISPPVVGALLVLAISTDTRATDQWTRILDKLKLSQDTNEATYALIEQAAEDILLHVPLENRRRKAEVFLEWAHSKNVKGGQRYQQLLDLECFSNELKHKKETPTEIPDPSRFVARHQLEDDQKIDWATLLGDKKFISSIEIEEPIKALDKGEFQHRNIITELFHRMAAQCQPSDYHAHLTAIVNVDQDVLPWFTLTSVLKSRLKDWGFHPGVREWRKTIPSRIISSRVGCFFDSDRFSGYCVNQMEEIFGLSRDEVLCEIIRHLPDHAEDISACALYGLASALIPSLQPEGAQNILTWVLPEWRKARDRERSSLQNLKTESIANIRQQIVPKMLWYLMGHPDKSLRWLAAHAVRRCVRFNHSEIVDGLASLLEDHDCQPLMLPGKPFYWLSARLWFFLLIDRLSAEAPSSVLPHARLLFDQTLSDHLPHALIRYLAKRAALRIAAHPMRPFKKSETSLLSSALKSAFRMVNDRTFLRRDRGPFLGGSSCKRFSFDSMDTLPYWYAPLGKLFALSGDEVAERAERWICDKWNAAHIGDNDPARRWSHSENWTLTSHRHGSEPLVERFDTYLEYHAMFCVASELLEQRPIVKDEWEPDPFDNWLCGWNLPRQDCWISDNRDRTPHEGQFWIRHEVPELDDWSVAPCDATFDLRSGIFSNWRNGFFVGWGSENRYDNEDSESLSIHSALVSPTTANALMRALQTATDPFDFKIPPEGDEFEIVDGDFRLNGWLKDVSHDIDGIASFDPLRNKLRDTIFLPGSQFSRWADLLSNANQTRFWRRTNSEKDVTVFERWNDDPATRHPYGFRTGGERLWVRVDDMLQFLRDEGWSLIIECMMRRYLHRGRHEETQREIERSKAKLYLVEANGTIKTLQGHYQFGKAHR